MLLRFLHRFEEWLIVALMAAMTLLTFLQVVLRYVFNSGLIWALEATTYLFAWLILTGISYGIRVNAHISVDLVVKGLRPQFRRIAGLLATAFCLLYAGLMIYGSWIYVDRMMIMGVEAEDIPVQRWLLAIILPIGFGLLLIRMLPIVRDIATGKRDTMNLADEAKDILRSSRLKSNGDDGGAAGR